MKIYRKILIGILSITMMTTLFTGCGNQDDITDNASTEDTTTTTDTALDDANTDNDNQTTVTTTTRVTLPDNVDYNKEITDGVVMNINGYDIGIEEYRYYFLNLKGYFDNGDESYWTGQDVAEVTDEEGNVTVEAKTAEEDTREKLSALKEHVLTYLTNNYCVELLAKDNNVSLDNDDLKKVEDDYNKIKKSYESEETRDFDTFEEYLNSTYCTKEIYMKSLTRQALESKVIRALYEDEVRKNVIPEYYHCKHILLSTLNLQYETETAPENATDEEKSAIDEKNAKSAEEAKSEIKKKAEEVLAKVNAGEDFDKLISEYNEDPGESQNEDGSYDGYYFKSGSMVQEFEDAFMQLEDNQTSDIVETSYGYHIIKRLPLDEQYIDDNIITFIMYDLATGETTQYYDDYVSKADEYNAKIEITFNDEYYNINTNSVIPKSSKFAYAETPKTTEVAE